MATKRQRKSVVKQGGIAGEASDAEDVTRDTYGIAESRPSGKDRARRVAEANSAAAAAGMPGIAVPKAEPGIGAPVPRAREKKRAPQARNKSQAPEPTSDRVASRRDVEKLKSPRSKRTTRRHAGR